jgi:hypothetical protein
MVLRYLSLSYRSTDPRAKRLTNGSHNFRRTTKHPSLNRGDQASPSVITGSERWNAKQRSSRRSRPLRFRQYSSRILGQRKICWSSPAVEARAHLSRLSADGRQPSALNFREPIRAPVCMVVTANWQIAGCDQRSTQSPIRQSQRLALLVTCLNAQALAAWQ